MNDFLSIWQYVVENCSGSTKDLFVTAIDIYEDEFGEIDDDTANEWFDVIRETQE